MSDAPIYIIPTTPESQAITITLGGRSLRLTIMWRDAYEGGYVLDIDDPVTGVPLVGGIPLITGVDLLAPYAYLGIPGGLIIFTDGDWWVTPSYETLGGNTKLYWFPPT